MAQRIGVRAIGLLAVMLGLAACGGGAAPASALPLTQTFQSGDGSISLTYPDGWVATDDLGQVTVASSSEAITALAPAPGQFQMRLFATPVSAIQGLPANATPSEILQFFAESLSTSGVTFNRSSELMIGGRAAAQIEGSGTDGQAVLLAADLGADNFVFVIAASAPGEMPRFLPTLIAILESLVYVPFAPETTASP